jgi:molybdate transport system permease protein
MFAGSLQGVTQTLPLAIYAEFDSNLDVALSIAALFVIITAAILLSLKLTSAWHSSRSDSRYRSASFVSS